VVEWFGREFLLSFGFPRMIGVSEEFSAISYFGFFEGRFFFDSTDIPRCFVPDFFFLSKEAVDASLSQLLLPLFAEFLG
jgi:hypothetical protein